MSDLYTEQKPSRRLWIFAGVAALALHIGGGALALAHLRPAESAEPLGAPAIEIGLELTSVHTDDTDLPPGPDTDAAAASPAVDEQKAEVKQPDLPKDIPTEANDPDRVVTPDKSREEDPKATVQTSAAPESVAMEATAMPSSEHIKDGPRSVAPVQGVGEDAQRVRAAWQKQLVAHLNRHKRYPTDHSKRGNVTVNFDLDRMGHVLAASIVKGSGDAAIDKAALSMIRRSDPVPRPPPVIADEGLNFTLPIGFAQSK